MLDRLMDVKSNLDFLKMDDARRKLEKEMNRYTKYPHMFKVEEIVER